jgi:hypothetical protein
MAHAEQRLRGGDGDVAAAIAVSRAEEESDLLESPEAAIFQIAPFGGFRHLILDIKLASVLGRAVSFALTPSMNPNRIMFAIQTMP